MIFDWRGNNRLVPSSGQISTKPGHRDNRAQTGTVPANPGQSEPLHYVALIQQNSILCEKRTIRNIPLFYYQIFDLKFI